LFEEVEEDEEVEKEKEGVRSRRLRWRR